MIEASGTAARPKLRVLGNALFSQTETHAEYGGVFPMMAKREHVKNIVPLFRSCMAQAIDSCANGGIQHETLSPEISAFTEQTVRDILSRENDLADQLLKALGQMESLDFDYIAVTEGPGLEPTLWVGISFAKALAVIFNKPIIPANHMEGHMVSVLMSGDAGDDETVSSDASPRVIFPALALLISGGHTELVQADAWGSYKILGQTVDDAIGEAFDKVARLLNLPYPGGPKISKLAAESRAEGLAAAYANAHGARLWNMPRPMLHSKDFNFSFSGIKTAVLYGVKDRLAATSQAELEEPEKKMLAEEFENAVTEVIVRKTEKALRESGARSLIIGGGVIANIYIRNAFKELISREFSATEEDGAPTVTLFTPSLDLSTDNSVMIGVAGYLRLIAAQAAGSEGAATYQPTDLAKLSDLKARGNLGY